MTEQVQLPEFLAWFDGWVEGKQTLNKEQLKRLKDKIKAIVVAPSAPRLVSPAPGTVQTKTVNLPFDSPQSIASTSDAQPRMSRGQAMDAGP